MSERPFRVCFGGRRHGKTFAIILSSILCSVESDGEMKVIGITGSAERFEKALTEIKIDYDRNGNVFSGVFYGSPWKLKVLCLK